MNPPPVPLPVLRSWRASDPHAASTTCGKAVFHGRGAPCRELASARSSRLPNRRPLCRRDSAVTTSDGFRGVGIDLVASSVRWRLTGCASPHTESHPEIRVARVVVITARCTLPDVPLLFRNRQGESHYRAGDGGSTAARRRSRSRKCLRRRVVFRFSDV